MLKNLSPLFATLFILAACSPKTDAPMDVAMCEQLTPGITHSQEQINTSRAAFDEAAKALDERLGLARDAGGDDEAIKALWADVLEARDQAKPSAVAALEALQTGFALMQDYTKAKCTNASSEDLDERLSRGVKRYKNSIAQMDMLPADWKSFFAAPAPQTEPETKPAPDPAQCQALEEERKTALAEAKAHSLKYDGDIARYRKAHQAQNRAIDLGQDTAEAWEELLILRDAAQPGIEGYIPLISNIFSNTKKGLESGCIVMSDKEKNSFNLTSAKTIRDIYQSKNTLNNIPLERNLYKENRKQTTTPRVGVINKTNQILCVHPKAKGPGQCTIEPNGTRIVELSATLEEAPTFDLLITGGIRWSKLAGEEPSAEDLSVCAKRTFVHNTGSVTWVIEPGIEDGCTLPRLDD